MEHFPDPDVIANYGQLLYLLGNLYEAIMQM